MESDWTAKGLHCCCRFCFCFVFVFCFLTELCKRGICFIFTVEIIMMP